MLYGVVSTRGAVSRIDWTQEASELGPLAGCAEGLQC